MRQEARDAENLFPLFQLVSSVFLGSFLHKQMGSVCTAISEPSYVFFRNKLLISAVTLTLGHSWEEVSRSLNVELTVFFVCSSRCVKTCTLNFHFTFPYKPTIRRIVLHLNNELQCWAIWEMPRNEKYTMMSAVAQIQAIALVRIKYIACSFNSKSFVTLNSWRMDGTFLNWWIGPNLLCLEYRSSISEDNVYNDNHCKGDLSNHR